MKEIDEGAVPERPRKKKRDYSWKSRWRVKKGKRERKNRKD
jgi:hypothetical protein